MQHRGNITWISRRKPLRIEPHDLRHIISLIVISSARLFTSSANVRLFNLCIKNNYELLSGKCKKPTSQKWVKQSETDLEMELNKSPKVIQWHCVNLQMTHVSSFAEWIVDLCKNVATERIKTVNKSYFFKVALIIYKRSLSRRRRRRVASKKAKSKKTIKRSVAKRRPMLKWKPHEAHFSSMNFPFSCFASINWFSPHSDVARYGESEAYEEMETSHYAYSSFSWTVTSWIICQHKKTDLILTEDFVACPKKALDDVDIVS